VFFPIFNRPDHLRCVNVCLLAYVASGDQRTQRPRYLDFSARYGGEWADALLAEEALPIGLAPNGVIYDLSSEDAAGYHAFVGEASKPTSALGKRSDMPHWLEDGQPRRHHPITLAVAAEISNDEGLAIHALDRARGAFALARQAFPDGRDHGCAARTVSAIARGHGREKHAGMITGVLAQRIA
jgi:hypothetical protein